MILLTATTDKLQVVTDAAVTVDVHASHMDMSQAAPPVVQGATSGRTNTAITTAATTDIVAAPAASTTRNVKTINIRNKHASTSVGVTVQFNQNATIFELYKATLKAGETLEYVEGVGFFVVTTAATAFYNRRVAGSDVTNSATTFADVTGLTAPVEANKHYNFEAHLYHFSAAATTGPRFAVNGPTMTAMRLQQLITETGSVAAAVMNSNITDITALDTAVATTDGQITTPVLSILSGWINPSAAGTFAIRVASEVATSAITIKVGSWMQLWEVA